MAAVGGASFAVMLVYSVSHPKPGPDPTNKEGWGRTHAAERRRRAMEAGEAGSAPPAGVFAAGDPVFDMRAREEWDARRIARARKTAADAPPPHAGWGDVDHH